MLHPEYGLDFNLSMSVQGSPPRDIVLYSNYKYIQ